MRHMMAQKSDEVRNIVKVWRKKQKKSAAVGGALQLQRTFYVLRKSVFSRTDF